MTLIRKDDEAPSCEGPVVPCIKERTCYCQPHSKEQVAFLVYLRANDTQEIARVPFHVGLLEPSWQREWLRPWTHFCLLPHLKLPWATELLQPDYSSHLHAAVHQDHDIATSQERTPGGKAFLENELRFWSSLLDSWDWEPHRAKKEKYSSWLAFPLFSRSYTQRHKQAYQIFLLCHESADGVAANTAPPWEYLGGTRVPRWGGI